MENGLPTTIRFGEAKCRDCGHHPIQHLSSKEVLTGVPQPCDGAADGEPPCTCRKFVPSDDTPGLILE